MLRGSRPRPTKLIDLRAVQCLGPDASSTPPQRVEAARSIKAPGRLSGPNQEESNPRLTYRAEPGLVAVCRKAAFRRRIPASWS